MVDIENTNIENTRPHHRTVLIAHEFDCFDVDISALSETRLSKEFSLAEIGGGYTFNLRGYPEGQQRKDGMGLANRTTLMDKMNETTTCVSERLMTLRVS